MKESLHKKLVSKLRKALAMIIQVETLLGDTCDNHAKVNMLAKPKGKRKAKSKGKK